MSEPDNFELEGNWEVVDVDTIELIGQAAQSASLGFGM
jgi:hypothetical protein